MKEFDNSQGKRKVNTPTFRLVVNGVEFSYTYIRKNACTSFKRLFKAYSQHDFSSVGGDLKGMAAFHLVNSASMTEGIQNRVFVYRDPVERVVSVYNNKFVQRSGALDIFKDFHKMAALNPEECTFEEFVKKYVSLIKKNVMIDAHLLPQVWHLYPINYNCAIKLSEVKEDMGILLGENVGNKFFSKPVNSTSQTEKLELFDANKMPASEIREINNSDGRLPSFGSYIDDELREVLGSVYKDDFSMISKI